MLCLKHTHHGSTSDFLSSAVRVAEYYGFVPAESVPRLQQSNAKRPAANVSDLPFARRDERGLVGAVKQLGALHQADRALLVWRIVPAKERPLSTTIELHVVGMGLPIAEALLILVADAIAAEAGVENRSLGLNSIGTPESSNRFVRDVGLYLRKHLETIAPALRPRAATDPLGTLVQLIERSHPGIARAPQSVEYLIEEERRRFWELIEYLEAAGLPYELNQHLLGSRECWSHTLFELSTIDAETGVKVPIAFGGRYDPLAARIAGRSMPSAMVSIACEVRGKTKVQTPSRTKPTLYFAHIGLEARRRALPVIEVLRHAGVAIHQSLMHERLGDQMTAAKQHGVPYMLIMGHKEAVEGTVIVREVSTNAQEAVLIDELVGYLKRHRIGMTA